MFGKAIVLAAWGGITAAYASWKIRRARKGITLRYDPRRDVHYDPLEKWEAIAVKTGRYALYTWYVIVALLIGALWLLTR